MTTTSAPTQSVLKSQVGNSVLPKRIRRCSRVGAWLKMNGLWAVFEAPTYRSLFCLKVVMSIQ